MQAKHKAKPSHNNTYIPQLCNSLPPRYWVFVVISRLWMALMVCSTGGTLHLIVSLTVPMTSAHTLKDTRVWHSQSSFSHWHCANAEAAMSPCSFFFYFNLHTQRFLHLDFYRIKSSACCHVGGDPERLPWTLYPLWNGFFAACCCGLLFFSWMLTLQLACESRCVAVTRRQDLRDWQRTDIW